MKTLPCVLIMTIVSFLSFAFKGKDNSGWTEKRVVVAGKVLNWESAKANRTIQLHLEDLLNMEDRTQLTVVIQDDGSFQVDFPLLYPQDFYLDYGTLATLFCSPGDSLYLEIDGAIWKNKRDRKPNGKYFVQATGGSAAGINQQISRFLNEIPNEKYIYGHANEAVEKKSPEEFTAYIQTREKEYRAYLKKFNKEHKTDKLFRTWADNKLKYESWHSLLRYRWEHPHYNGMHRDSLRLPANYFSFLDKYNMNDNKLISMEQAGFLQEFRMYAMNKTATAANGKTAAPSNHNDVFANIKHNTSGFTQQVFLASLIHSILRSHALEIYEQYFEASMVPDPYLQQRLKAEYENQKAYLANQNTAGANLTSIGNDITAGLIQQIASNYKGKVIYIDFWAPWCGPCMDEMPSSKLVQTHFEDEDVVFLFLASNTKDDSWKATIANKSLTGEHINLTNDQFNVLSSEFGVSGIPHYTLIDKKGNIVLKDAPRPSDVNKLIPAIQKLLE